MTALTGQALKDAEDVLFEEWRRHLNDPPIFIRDGVIEPEGWGRGPKVLLLLKEPYTSDEWDFRETVREDRISHYTWSNAARWAQACRAAPHPPGWPEVEQSTEEFRREVLTSVAIVNVKKTPGGASTNASELLQVARRDHAFLHRQFEMYRPDYTILCGTAQCLNPLFGDTDEAQGMRFQTQIDGKEFAFRRNPTLGMAIRMPHPQARGARARELYERLVRGLEWARHGAVDA